MRQGITLVELMLVLAVSSLAFGIALPRLSCIVDQIEVSSAANHVIAAHQRARMLAITRGQAIVLTVDSAALSIRVRGELSPLLLEDGPAAARVALEGSARQFTFSPAGLTLGLSNATLRLSRGSATRSMIISRLGRIRASP
jgi:prepilin-type N-terminal cleavage/methylation domain-containing protein